MARSSEECPRIGLVWRADSGVILKLPSRLEPIRDALGRLGVTPEPIAFSEANAEETQAQLLRCDGALVWVDPLTDGVNRMNLDTILRTVSSQGVWVSAHPDVILKMGVKEVLARTKSLGWGSDTHVYESVETFRSDFPTRLAADRVRVLKQSRGNSNQGVWKVELVC